MPEELVQIDKHLTERLQEASIDSVPELKVLAREYKLAGVASQPVPIYNFPQALLA